MSLKRFQEAISLLTKLYSVASYSNEIYGLIWYHALAMDFLLDTGNALETYENCEKFYFQNVSNREIEDESSVRLEANFQTFLSRLHQHGRRRELSSMTKLKKTFKLERNSAMNKIFTALRLYESSDDRDFRETIEKDLKKLKNFPQFLRVRFSLLKIQRKSMITTKSNILKRLDDLKNRSIHNRNFLCVDLIKHFEERLTAQNENENSNNI